jgi:hypothetical protein
MLTIPKLLLGFLAAASIHATAYAQNGAPTETNSAEKSDSPSGPSRSNHMQAPVTSAAEQVSLISCTVTVVRFSVGGNTRVSKSVCPENLIPDD